MLLDGISYMISRAIEVKDPVPRFCNCDLIKKSVEGSVNALIRWLMALIKCSECGHEISDKAAVCPHCGAVNNTNAGALNPNASAQTIIVQQEQRKTNGLGTAGFVLALIVFIFCWIPGLDFILWLLGLLFSLIGVFKAPRGLAIAGLCISLIGLLVILLIFGSIFAIMDGLSSTL